MIGQGWKSNVASTVNFTFSQSEQSSLYVISMGAPCLPELPEVHVEGEVHKLLRQVLDRKDEQRHT